MFKLDKSYLSVLVIFVGLLFFPLAMPFWILPIVAIVPLVVIGLFVNLPIGNTAHFGGLIAGIVYGKYLKNKYKNKTEIISKKFS